MIENIETPQDILDKINDETNQYSGLYSVVKDFQSLVGGIEYDNEGKIKSARAVRFDMFGKMNVTEAHLGNLLGDIDNYSVAARNSGLGTCTI